MDREAINAELQRINALSLWDFEAEPLVNGTLIIRGSAIYERVRRLDETMYGEAPDAGNPVSDQMAKLNAAFGR